MTPGFSEARDRLKDLHDLIAEGKAESALAEHARQRIADVWETLTERERELFEGLSADLYSLSGKELPDPELAEVSKADLRSRLMIAYREQRDWYLSLKLLRTSLDLDPEVTAFLRARCWMGLGDPQVSLWFMMLAENVAPRPNRFTAQTLALMSQLGLTDKALQRAEESMARSDVDLETALISLTVIFSARSGEPVDRTAVHSAIEMARQTLARYRNTENQDRNPHWALVVTHHTAAAIRRLGPEMTVRTSYQSLLADFHEIDVIWCAYGLDVLPENRHEAENAFLQAISKRTQLIWPYAEMARLLLNRKDFPLAASYARQARELSRDERVRAEMLVYEATASKQLGAPPERVEQLILDAKLLYPLIVEGGRDDLPVVPLPWDEPMSAALNAA